MRTNASTLAYPATDNQAQDITNELFALCPRGGKNPIHEGWNVPANAVTYDQALSHRGNIGILLHGDLICVDIDSNAAEQLRILGPLANTTTITRDNAPERVALLYRTDGEIRTRKYRTNERTDDSFDVEILTAAPDGKGKHKLIRGTHKGGTYILDKSQPIKRLTTAEHECVIAMLTIGMVESGARKPRPQQPRPQPTSNVSDLIKQTPCEDVFQHYGKASQVQEESRGKVRLLGNGGLIIRPEENDWYCHSDGQHGDALAAIAYCETGSTDTSDPQLFRAYLSKLAEIAGVPLPDTHQDHRKAINPLTGEKVKLDDVLDLMRQMIAEHQFTGRNKDYQRQVALAHVQNFSNAGNDVAHGSRRQLSTLAGVSPKSVGRANSGREITVREPICELIQDTSNETEIVIVHDEYGREIERREEYPTINRPMIDEDGNPRYRNRTIGYEGPCLQDWLIQKTDNAIGGSAHVWTIHPEVWKKYALIGTTSDFGLVDSDAPTHESQEWFQSVHISEIRNQMGSDAWQRQFVPLHLREPETRAEHIVRTGHAEKVTTGEYIKSFGATGLAIVSQLTVRSMSVSELSNVLGHHRNVIRANLHRLITEPEKASRSAIVQSAKSDTDGRVRLWSLAEGWQETVRDITPHMYTYGTTQRRKIRYNSERIEFLSNVIPNIYSPDIRETAERILKSAQDESKKLSTAAVPVPLSTIPALSVTKQRQRKERSLGWDEQLDLFARENYGDEWNRTIHYNEMVALFSDEQMPAPPPADFDADVMARFEAGYMGIPVDEDEYYLLWDEYDRCVAVGERGPWLSWIEQRVK